MVVFFMFHVHSPLIAKYPFRPVPRYERDVSDVQVRVSDRGV